MPNKAFCGFLIAASGLALSLTGAATDIRPDTTGTYTYQYEGLEANTPYVVLVTEGLSDEGDKPVITEQSVLYYNVFFSDDDGTLPISFVPTMYRDATVFIASGGLEKPIIGCYALADGAKELSALELTLEKDVYTVYGEGRYSYVNYSLRAFDAFGYETQLPPDTKLKLDDNDGGCIRMLPESSSLELNGMTHEGTYTLTVTTGNSQVSRSFEVRRNPKPTTLRYSVISAGSDKETDYPSYIIFGTTTVEGTTYEPSSLTFIPTAYDQYGDIMDTDFVFSYSPYDRYGALGDSVVYSTGKDCFFVPPTDPEIGETLRYDFFIDPVGNSGLSAEISLTVIGSTVYDGKVLSLFEKLDEALEYQAQMKQGSIVVASDGSSVPSTSQYVKPDVADRLNNTVTNVTALLVRAAAGEEIAEDVLNENMSALQNAITTFGKALTNGSYSRITSLGFDSSHVYLAVGTSKSIPANVTPARPSERPVYSSADPMIAVVNASTGNVTAVREGETTITVSDVHDTISASYTLTVYTGVSAITPANGTVTANAGTSLSDLFTFAPANHTDMITYASSDTDVASVGRTTGSVSLHKAGTTVITATSLGGKSASVTVKAVEPFLAVSSTAAKPGTEAAVRVTAEDLISVSDLTLRFYYDSAFFTFTGVTDAGLLNGVKPTVKQDKGYVELTYSGAVCGDTLSGTLCELSFAVASSAPYGKYALEYDADAADADGHYLTLLLPAGKKAELSVADVLYGDVNSDGTVDALDFMRLAKYYAGYDVVINASNADINGDGKLSADDVKRFAAYLVGEDVALGKTE